MNKQCKKDVLTLLMEKVPLIREQRLRQSYPKRNCKQNETLIPSYIPGFKINNQSTYKLYSSRKYNPLDSSIIKTQPSFSLNSTISKISLSPRPIKTHRYIRIDTANTYRKPTVKKQPVSQIKPTHKYCKPSFSDWDIDRWDTYDNQID